MDHITSQDGTRIAYEKSGNGFPLVIVGGALADHTFYAPLAEVLAKDFTVYTYDRRGRGESGDTKPYAVEREIEDIAALIDATGEPVVLYGHSAGSALALRAAAAGLPIAKLLLADPPYTLHSDNDETVIAQFAEETAKVQQLHDQGDHRENVARFLGGFGLPDEAVEDTLNSPAAESMIKSANALPYDYAVLGDGLVPTELASKVKAPTVILAFGHSLDAGKQLAEAISNAELKELPSSTYEMAPGELANELKELL
jgi:pimeloyl-ACP methyl ester carboxylesterase